jgi:hypothetical protein
MTHSCTLLATPDSHTMVTNALSVCHNCPVTALLLLKLSAAITSGFEPHHYTETLFKTATAHALLLTVLTPARASRITAHSM